jgi:hydrogenase nickel incorporation protein HypA/HybF
MHELSITNSIVEAVTDRTGDAKVAAVQLRVGKLSGVLPDAMRFCFDMVTAGTTLQGARLDICEPEGKGHCRRCGNDFALPDPVLLCPCGSADVQVLSGRELSIASVEVV